MRIVIAMAAGFIGLIGPVVADASIDIQATVTADNHYAIYYGKADGSQLFYVGRNDAGLYDGNGQYNWRVPETWNFSTPDFIYVAAWDDGGPQAWIGQFDVKINEQSQDPLLLSNTSLWVYSVLNQSGDPSIPQNGTYYTAPAGTEFGNPFTMGQFGARIGQIGSWQSPQASADNGASPWGTIAGISTSADFIWHDTLNSTSSSDGRYVLFRTGDPIVPGTTLDLVPEPSGLVIWGAVVLMCGVAGLRFWCRRGR